LTNFFLPKKCSKINIADKAGSVCHLIGTLEDVEQDPIITPWQAKLGRKFNKKRVCTQLLLIKRIWPSQKFDKTFFLPKMYKNQHCW
jgi:hypothetical protein